MSQTPDPGPFPGFDLEQIFRMLQADGPVNWQVANQSAGWVAREGGSSPPGGGDVRRLSEIARAAQAHVGEAMARPELADVTVKVLARDDWALANLAELKPVLERMATAMSPPQPPGLGNDPFSRAMGGVVPMLFGAQMGFVFGQLAKEVLSQHELLLPWSGKPIIGLVASNLAEFGEAWSLPAQDVEFVIALHEAAHAALAGIDWIRRRLLDAVSEHAGGFQLDQSGLQARLSSFDPSDPSSMQQLMGSPESMLQAMETPAQQAARARFVNLATVLEGLAEHFAGEVARTMVPGSARVSEALRRRLGEMGDVGRFVRRMLGVDLAPADHELGRAFCAGVVERAGSAPLLALLEREELLPRNPELAAPGLWLARIELEGPSAP